MATRRRPRATSRRGWRARASRSVRRGRRTTRWRTSSWSSPRRAASPETMLARGRARAAVIIPEHFEREIRRHRPVEAQVLVDATDGNTAQLIRGSAGQITRAFARPLGGATVPAIQTATRLWFNPGREPRKFYGPGFLVLGLSIFPTVLAALAMSREGEQKTILQVYVSSISAHEFLLGKILAGMVIGFAQCVLLAVLMFTLFGLRFAGDPTPVIVGSVLFVFCGLAWRTMRRMQVKA